MPNEDQTPPYGDAFKPPTEGESVVDPPDPTIAIPALPPQAPPAPPQPFGASTAISATGATVSTDPANPGVTMIGEPVVTNEAPWYKQPGQLALLFFALLAIGGLIVLLFVLGGDDGEDDGRLSDEATGPAAVVVTRFDSNGDPRSVSLSAIVSVTSPDDGGFDWVVPSEATPGEPAQRRTDASGRVEFRWEPDADTDPLQWSTSLELGEVIQLPLAQAGQESECSIESGNDSNDLSIDIEYAGGSPDEDPAAPEPRIARYTFPNVEFQVGDRIVCSITDRAVDLTPVTSITDSTIVESTIPETSVVESTVPETTTTLPPAATTTPAPQTTTTTTTTTTIAATTPTQPPPPAAVPGSVLEFLNSRGDLSAFVGLIQTAGLVDQFNDPSRRFTVFVPNNAAVDALRNDPNAPDLTNAQLVRDLVLAHVLDGEALSEAEVATSASIAVQSGGPQPVGVDPTTIGGARFIEANNQADQAIVHVIETVLTPIIE